MLAAIVPLWMVGFVCLLAAIMGESVEAGSLKLPALKKREVRIAVALIGVLALVLGLVALLRGEPGSGDTGSGTPAGDPSRTSAAPSSSGPSLPPSPTPSTDPVSPPPASSTPPAAPAPGPVATRWHGTLTLDGDNLETGWALDSVPPSREPAGDIGLSCQLTCAADQVSGNALAPWSGSSPPTREQCRDRLNTTVGTQQLDVETGTMGCVGTARKRVAYFRMLSMDGSRMRLEVTVWQLPPA